MATAKFDTITLQQIRLLEFFFLVLLLSFGETRKTCEGACEMIFHFVLFYFFTFVSPSTLGVYQEKAKGQTTTTASFLLCFLWGSGVQEG